MENRFLIQHEGSIKTYKAAEEEATVYDFAEDEKSLFEENDMVLFDGSAKLKTNYISAMEIDASFTESGTLLRNVINKASFENVEKVEVTK